MVHFALPVHVKTTVYATFRFLVSEVEPELGAELTFFMAAQAEHKTLALSALVSYIP